MTMDIGEYRDVIVFKMTHKLDRQRFDFIIPEIYGIFPSFPQNPAVSR